MDCVLPIYMYHQVAPKSDPNYEPYLYVTPQALHAQIKQLERSGFELITLREAVRRISTGEKFHKAAVLTFDDLYHTFYEHAFPVLCQEGVAATAFAIGESLQGGTVLNIAGGMGSLSSRELGEISEAGIEIGSHTMTHAELTLLDDAALRSEISDSRKLLEDILGQECVSLCYPRGRFSQRVVDCVREAGYSCACSTLRGNVQSGDNLFAMKRIRAKDERRGLSLWYTTTGFYDWWNRKRAVRDAVAFAAEDYCAGGKAD